MAEDFNFLAIDSSTRGPAKAGTTYEYTNRLDSLWIHQIPLQSHLIPTYSHFSLTSVSLYPTFVSLRHPRKWLAARVCPTSGGNSHLKIVVSGRAPNLQFSKSVGFGSGNLVARDEKAVRRASAFAKAMAGQA